MPRELIATNELYQPAGAVLPPGDWPEGSTRVEPSGKTLSLSIGWAKDGRWTQVYMIPSGWQSTSDWHIITVDPEQIDHLIHTLKRAKRQAFREPVPLTLPPEYSLSVPLSSPLNSRH